jgi:hypothetical protein
MGAAHIFLLIHGDSLFLSLLFTLDGSVTHFFLLCILRCIIALLLMYLIIGETQTTICTSYGCKICSE